MTPGPTIRYVYHRPGRGTSTFRQQLVRDDASVKILLATYAGRPLSVHGRVTLEPGAPIIWFVFPDAWYDVGRFHLADGTFTGWYTNLCTPVEFGAGEWASTDLFLDLWQFADGGTPVWLDEDEFAEAVQTGVLRLDLAERAERERRAITAQVAVGGWPPEVARATDLAALAAED